MSHPLAPLLATLVRLYCGATARWRGCRPELSQRLYVANHTSHLDAVVLWSALPRELRARTRPIAAADYWSRGLRRYLATRVFDAILIPRGAPGRSAVEREAAARAAIAGTLAGLGPPEAGRSAILFPEGTRSPDGRLQPLKSGVYHLCRERPGLELVPVWLENLGRILPKGGLAPVPFVASATFGPPLALGEGEAKDAFLARLRAAILALAADPAAGGLR
ncbi:MAG: 1-acyl-sn-glycerol-3-phosphate acyltransferase [Holophagales bacterium]|nr:MAG: 1-acyl-sn-glycerol-3-phosphate acyltransferase [Holophagales bacterium]